MTVTVNAPTRASQALPCPPWCNGACADWDDQMHAADTISVPVRGENDGVTAPVVDVEMSRVDDDGNPGDVVIEMFVDKAGCLTADHAGMTSGQARQLAAALLNAADVADGLVTR